MSNHTNPVAPIADLPEIKNENVQTTSVPENSGNSSNTIDKKNIRILIVEDEPDAKQIFKTLIEVNTGYSVADASNGIEALKRLESEEFQLVLLDIIMPQMDGIEVLKTIKEDPNKYHNPKVVMLTNLTSADAEESSKQYHADGYLTKIEFEPDMLVKRIDEFLS